MGHKTSFFSVKNCNWYASDWVINKPVIWFVKFAFDCKILSHSSKMQMLYSFEINFMFIWEIFGEIIVVIETFRDIFSCDCVLHIFKYFCSDCHLCLQQAWH